MKSGFSKKLSLLRRQRGISQKKAAKDLGISQALLSHYENGIREPKFEFVDRACTYYGVQADYILGRRGAGDIVISCTDGTSERIAEAAKRLTEFLADIESDDVYAAAGNYIEYMADVIMATAADPNAMQRPEYDAYGRILYARLYSAAAQANAPADYSFPEKWQREIDVIFKDTVSDKE